MIGRMIGRSRSLHEPLATEFSDLTLETATRGVAILLIGKTFVQKTREASPLESCGRGRAPQLYPSCHLHRTKPYQNTVELALSGVDQ